MLKQMRIMNLGLMKKRNSRVLTNSANFLQKFLPRCTLLLSVVGRHNRNLTEKCSARIFPKSPSATSLNSDVKLNSGLASTEVKTENSNVVIFVKIIKEKTHKVTL